MEKRFAWLEFFMYLVLSLGVGTLIVLWSFSDLSRWAPLLFGTFTALVVMFGGMRCPMLLDMLRVTPGSKTHTILSLIGVASGLLHGVCCWVIVKSYSIFLFEFSAFDNFVVLVSNNYIIPLYLVYFFSAVIFIFMSIKPWYQFEAPKDKIVYVGKKRLQPKEIFMPLPFYKYTIRVEE